MILKTLIILAEARCCLRVPELTLASAELRLERPFAVSRGVPCLKCVKKEYDEWQQEFLVSWICSCEHPIAWETKGFAALLLISENSAKKWFWHLNSLFSNPTETSAVPGFKAQVKCKKEICVALSIDPSGKFINRWLRLHSKEATGQNYPEVFMITPMYLSVGFDLMVLSFHQTLYLLLKLSPIWRAYFSNSLSHKVPLLPFKVTESLSLPRQLCKYNILHSVKWLLHLINTRFKWPVNYSLDLPRDSSATVEIELLLSIRTWAWVQATVTCYGMRINDGWKIITPTFLNLLVKIYESKLWYDLCSWPMHGMS